jgi:hypothetical protein
MNTKSRGDVNAPAGTLIFTSPSAERRMVVSATWTGRRRAVGGRGVLVAVAVAVGVDVSVGVRVIVGVGVVEAV